MKNMFTPKTESAAHDACCDHESSEMQHKPNVCCKGDDMGVMIDPTAASGGTSPRLRGGSACKADCDCDCAHDADKVETKV